MIKKNFQITICDNREELGKVAAQEVGKSIRELLVAKKEISIVLGAAPSQDELFKYLVLEKGIEWERVHAFHMDEYIGLPAEDPQGFASYLNKHIVTKVPFKSINYLNGNAANIEDECKRYTALLKKHTIDIVCLGFGENGHIAFNDPGIGVFSEKAWVKVVELDQKCRQQQVNDGCFESIDMVPAHSITLTIPALFSGTNIICTVPFKRKANAVKEAILGPVTEKCPASILRLHSSVKIVLDRDSSSLISNIEIGSVHNVYSLP